ncbi:MAG: dUTP diphosphatase [Pseudomonadota bacterium]
MDKVKICVLRVRPEQDADLPLPEYMTEHSAGLDLRAAVTEPLVLTPGQIALVPTGLAMALPPGFEAQIRPRSGLAYKKGVTLINAPGTIDSDYRGEIALAVINLGREEATIRRGDRVAQMIVSRVWRVELELVDSLDRTPRGAGGFGHTG